MNTACEHEEFEFLDFSILRGNGLDLVLCDVVDAEFEDGRAPMYCFEIRLEGQSGHIGDLSLCVGEGGQVGLEGQLSYEIDEEFQGNHYSSKACRVAAELGAWNARGMDCGQPGKYCGLPHGRAVGRQAGGTGGSARGQRIVPSGPETQKPLLLAHRPAPENGSGFTRAKKLCIMDEIPLTGALPGVK